jgi:hypothetical protein
MRLKIKEFLERKLLFKLINSYTFLFIYKGGGGGGQKGGLKIFEKKKKKAWEGFLKKL